MCKGSRNSFLTGILPIPASKHHGTGDPTGVEDLEREEPWEEKQVTETSQAAVVLGP